MPIKITQRKAEDVPQPQRGRGRVSHALDQVMRELTRLAPGMVLVIETEDQRDIRTTKLLITRAANQLGMPVRHWHSGNEVFASPRAAAPTRRPRSERASLGDHRD